MSYRTRINGSQIFGNNEYYPEWIDFIQSQGIEVGEEGNYEGEITDFMGALEVIEKITMNIYKDRKSKKGSVNLFDFESIPRSIENADLNDKFASSLFDEEFEVISNAYAFLSYQFYLACEDKLEKDEMFKVPGHTRCYKVREGESLHVYAG